MSGATGRWEYHVENLYGQLSAEHLNALGNERWELASTISGIDNQPVLIFKRPGPTLAEQITLDQRARVEGEQRDEQRIEQDNGQDKGVQS
jgi:hypothetical protein